MSTSQLDRPVARRRTRVAATIAGALLLGGLWYAAWALARDEAPPSAESILAGAAADVPKPAPIRFVSARVDPSSVGLNLGQIANRPKPPTPGPSATPDPGAAASTLAVRFLGVIVEPDRLLALVHAGGRQRVVAPGGVIPADAQASRLLRVRQVTREALVLEDGGKEVRLDRAPRTGPAVTYVSANPALAAAAAASATAQAMSSLERLREMQRRLDPRQMATAVPEVKAIAGDAVAESETAGEPPSAVPRAVPVTPDGVKPK